MLKTVNIKFKQETNSDNFLITVLVMVHLFGHSTLNLLYGDMLQC